MRTLQERLKFDCGLYVGTSLVAMARQGHLKHVLVTIGKRGKVTALMQPTASDMYLSHFQVKGDTTITVGGVYVWPAKDPEFMSQFVGPPETIIEI